MSQENVELATAFFDAYNARDSEAVDGLLDPDAEITTLTGRAGLPTRWSPGTTRQYFEQLDEAFADLRVEIEAYRELGERVVALGVIRGAGKASHVEVADDLAVVFVVRNSRFVHVETYNSWRAALEAAGLSESAMSDENEEVVRQVVGAFNRRDLAAMTQWFAPEVEWEPGGPAAVERPLYRGRDEVASAFAATWETWEVFHVEESEVRALGDSVVWLGSARLRGDASHVDFDQPFAVHFLVRGGKVLRFRGFVTWQAALEAAGLSE